MPKNNIPILTCFLFNVKDGVMEITGTDNETTLKCSLQLNQSDGDACFAVPSKQLLDILKEIPEQPLSIDFNPTTLQIDLSYQNGHFSLQAENGNDYPQMQENEGEGHTIILNADILNKAFGCTIVAASSDESRKVMNGLFFDITPKDLSIVASDGHKLVCYKILCDTHDISTNFILPRKPASLLRSILEKMTADITLRTFDNGNARIEAEEFKMDCRLLQEKYPNYKNVIPKNNPNIATIDRASFQSALRRMLVACDKGTELIKFNFEAGKMTLSTENLNYAQSAEEKLVCQYEGTALRIGFRGDYMLDLLNNVQSTDVILQLSDPSRAGLILPSEQEKDTDIVMLLMPLLIAN